MEGFIVVLEEFQHRNKIFNFLFLCGFMQTRRGLTAAEQFRDSVYSTSPAWLSFSSPDFGSTAT